MDAQLVKSSMRGSCLYFLFLLSHKFAGCLACSKQYAWFMPVLSFSLKKRKYQRKFKANTMPPAVLPRLRHV